MKFRFIEVFAGQAEVTRMFRYAGLPAVKLDLLYMDDIPGRQNPMDLLTPAGFSILGKNYDILFSTQESGIFDMHAHGLYPST